VIHYYWGDVAGNLPEKNDATRLFDVWASVNSAGILWAYFRPDNVVFHSETGETHLLSDLPSLLLEMLQASTRSGHEICEAAATACGTKADAIWHGKILALLETLEELELIEGRPSASA
jgi:PqqD family protein of HPr-rel-A system